MVDDNGDLMLTYMCSIKEPNCTNRRFVDLAPEVSSFKKVTKAIDWWSYGIILYELLVGVVSIMVSVFMIQNFYFQSFTKVHPEGLSKYTILKIPKYVSAEAKSLLKQVGYSLF